MLTQQVNTALNPAIPLLLLGVPLFDTAFVIIKRIYYGKSPFVEDKNHVHHQLLARKLDHNEAVVIIYLVQAQGLPAQRIAAITFTNKASREMRERLSK